MTLPESNPALPATSDDTPSTLEANRNRRADTDGDDDTGADSADDGSSVDARSPSADGPREVVTTFEQMGLSRTMLKDIATLGFKAPMPIQCEAIPIAMDGHDIVGCAQTGTGKSAAFLIPIIEGIRKRRPLKVKTSKSEPCCPRAMILGPTRELVQQLENQVEALTRSAPVSCAVIVGGKKMGDQYKKLERGVTIVLATPGRLLDHLQRGTLTLSALEWIVLDEADRMFDMGFAPQIRRVLARAPRVGERQTMMFSATMPRELTALAEEHLEKPVRIEITPPNMTAEGVHHDVKLLSNGTKLDFLIRLLDQHFADGGGRVLIFTRRKMDADNVANSLRNRGVECLRMHADRTQEQREGALQRFREGKCEVLVATDLASRGIDVENIVRVINYDFPQNVDDYIHRAGRTARAGTKGRATSIVEPQDLPLLREIEKRLGEPLPRHGSEDDDDEMEVRKPTKHEIFAAPRRRR
ncbi:MAG: DEAD/DEAH box helicase [Planctomycetota bacterium]